MTEFRDKERTKYINSKNSARKTSDSEMDRLAKISAERILKNVEKRVLDFIEKEKKKPLD